jgi:uncharacterized membrane protein
VGSRRRRDEAVEQLLGNLLRVGVILAAAVATLGGVLYLVRYGATSADHRAFVGEPAALRSVSGILATAAAFEPAALVQLGLILLIATPIARVAFSLVAFALQRDVTYVAVTALVFGILLFSLFAGHP